MLAVSKPFSLQIHLHKYVCCSRRAMRDSDIVDVLLLAPIFRWTLLFPIVGVSSVVCTQPPLPCNSQSQDLVAIIESVANLLRIFQGQPLHNGSSFSISIQGLIDPAMCCVAFLAWPLNVFKQATQYFSSFLLISVKY